MELSYVAPPNNFLHKQAYVYENMSSIHRPQKFLFPIMYHKNKKKVIV